VLFFVPVNPQLIYNRTFDDFVARTDKLLAQGFQPQSLSAYGEHDDILWAGVFDKRPGPPIRKALGYAVADFAVVQATNAADGFFPILVSAVGGGSATRISAFFARLPAAEATEMTIGQDLHTFVAEVGDRGADGWIPRSATIYDDTNTPSRVAAVWERNTANAAWTAAAGMTQAQHQEHFVAQTSAWTRPTFVTGSTRNLCRANTRA
jgi:hypothetical protein